MDIEQEMLHRFFNGDATPEEQEQVRTYLEDSPENWKEYLRERRLFDTIILKNSTIVREKQTNWKLQIRTIMVKCMKVAALLVMVFTTLYFWLKGTLCHLIGRSGSREVEFSVEEIESECRLAGKDKYMNNSLIHRRRLIWLSTSMTAACIVAFVWWWEVHNQSNQQDILDVMSHLSYVPATDDEIHLVISTDKIIPLEKGSTVSYSSQGTVMVNKEKIDDVIRKQKNSGDSEYNQIIVPKGKNAHLFLADGSELYINANTRVIYPRVFHETKREIFVDGEIYIDVKPDKTAPFIVRTAKFEVEVLGTTFNVNAYSKEPAAEVVLVRGLINIKDNAKRKMQLTPNQLASISAGVLVNKRVVDPSNYIAWIQSLMILDAEPLGNVLRKLQQYYGVNITIEDSVEKLLMHGSLDLKCPVSEALRRISITAPITIQEVEAGFYIKKRE